MASAKQEDCIMAGMSIFREHESFRAEAKTPIIWQTNLRGLVSKEDFIIPHSELAMHSKAAGQEVLAFFMTRNLAFAAYETADGGCGYVYGRPGEVLQIPLIDRTNEMWPR
jgi:hypothetical protein